MNIWKFEEAENGSFIIPDGYPPFKENGRAVALGYFDGVHAGHRVILEKLTYEARLRNIPATVHTFSEPPKSKKPLLDEEENGVLSTVSEKCVYFSMNGADETVLFPFGKHLSEMSPEDFLETIVIGILNARVLVVGEDYRFGKERRGDGAFLTKWGDQRGVKVFLIPQRCFEGVPISSSLIRSLLRGGETCKANRLLGYPISYQGTVQEGKKIGRTLGFPTANIPIVKEKLIPAFGVYASLLHTSDSIYPSITSIGVRPTVNRTGEGVLIETMIFDRDTDLYGKQIRVYLLSYMREEMRFENLEMLKEQIQRDMAKVRQYHERHSYEYSILLPGVL